MVSETRSLKSVSSREKDNRVKRLFSFANLLKQGEYLNATDIAKQLNVSKRTVFRDLQTLRSAGVIVRYDSNESTYQINDSIFPYELLPSPDDLSELLLHANVSALPLTTQRGKRVRRATEVLLKLLPSTLKEQQCMLINAMRRIKSIDDDRRNEIMDIIMRAITTGKCLNLEVLSSKTDDTSPWEFQPDGMVFDEGTFLLVGTLVHNGLSLKVSIDKIIKVEVSVRAISKPQLQAKNKWTNPDIVIK